MEVALQKRFCAWDTGKQVMYAGNYCSICVCKCMSACMYICVSGSVCGGNLTGHISLRKGCTESHSAGDDDTRRSRT